MPVSVVSQKKKKPWFANERLPGWNLIKITADAWPASYQDKKRAAAQTLSARFGIELVKPRTGKNMFNPLSEMWSALDPKNGDHYYLQVLPASPSIATRAGRIKEQIRVLEAQLLELEVNADTVTSV